MTAKDETQGSGVAATYYALNGGAPKLYTEPFTTPFGTAVRFLSIDKAGNTESPQQIIVDDAPDTLDTSEPISDGAHIRRKIVPRETRTGSASRPVVPLLTGCSFWDYRPTTTLNSTTARARKW